ncbi:hypothetical protein LP032_046 [Listeria phage LP-032]|uniref:Uncharacterized protein n=10 Tax=Homburgvirus TaxID=1921125 RepID=A0A6C0QZR0_9CAUD|nr:hypothetical protein LP110_084 [Listeria phage LP-110]YP_008240480.1 hypothetical protein LP037_002 [Listeria phage LP-037]YP_009044087.1 hypothetical protein LP026_002 [Listeria phage LP-026]YP_009045059.1 hypothetical protein LP114_004 [Listeria phage LP-114]AHL18895.1 hypothetical protein LP032_046 [Listeria phage LP-032]AWY07666.1 hypothetical protein [Listeria phage LP-KV022]QDK04532.1 hypothetical protein FK481_0018 [Listeria phage LP-010]QDK04640.1 hypothetical protein FK482_0018 [
MSNTPQGVDIGDMVRYMGCGGCSGHYTHLQTYEVVKLSPHMPRYFFIVDDRGNEHLVKLGVYFKIA